MSGPVQHTFPDQFQTERLLIRAPRAGDGAELYAALSESLAELQPWMPWAHEPISPESCELNILRASDDFLARRDLRLQLYLRTDPGTLVGSSGLHRIDWGVPRFEIGYWLRTPFAGRGFATEAVRGIAAFAFRELGARRLEIWCDDRNTQSSAVARRVGFRPGYAALIRTPAIPYTDRSPTEEPVDPRTIAPCLCPTTARPIPPSVTPPP